MSNLENEILIPPETKKVKLSNSELIDMLSDLPDCVILHILSFLNTKDAVRTCVLSVRWKDMWKRVPALILDKSDFGTIKIFAKFVSEVLSLRDSSIALQSIDFDDNCCLEPRFIKRVVNYAISNNVQRLGLSARCNIEQIPPNFFSCHTLTYLKLSLYPKSGDDNKTLFPKSFNLPSLTSLCLGNFAFCAGDDGRIEPFSAFNRLNSLVLQGFAVRGALTLCISSATLVNLTLNNHSFDFFEIEICTPSVCSFAFIGRPYQKIFGRGLSYVKHVDIHAEVSSLDIEPPLLLLSWLLDLDNTKSLTVTASTLQVLFLNSNLLKTEFFSLGNLKLLKVKIKPLMYGFRQRLIEAKLQKIRPRKEAAKLRKSIKAGLEPFAPIPDGIVNFLTQNSPSAEVEIIDCSWR
ncbi:F-box/FBD/LRR-repeat protein At1g78750-like [Vicia villosa]|uniref:F-box/FBD/LRR-repeat protein At1g78750-like n=1 Tax=Vicia villosa TaxID=3911 RepID=UPI00273C3E4E|nr:F-box/FBD/LRR-repeat protein At1g78750-like [Vicia villosa]